MFEIITAFTDDRWMTQASSTAWGKPCGLSINHKRLENRRNVVFRGLTGYITAP